MRLPPGYMFCLDDDDTQPIDIGDDLLEALKEYDDVSPFFDSAKYWKKPDCTCGAYKTYGKNISKEFHSTWCDTNN
jgi:hypothetical protein